MYEKDFLSNAPAAQRAQILFDLDRRARAQAEAAEMRRRHGRPWQRLTQWRRRQQ
jgi:anti-sigma-K factor RskA